MEVWNPRDEAPRDAEADAVCCACAVLLLLVLSAGGWSLLALLVLWGAGQ